ncbi:MAG: hypothetical protein ABIK36_20525 [Pseudomonadota bacterium]
MLPSRAVAALSALLALVAALLVSPCVAQQPAPLRGVALVVGQSG